MRKSCLLVLCAMAWSGPGEGAPAFEEGFKGVRGLLERGQHAEGKKRLKKLLEEHAKAPYVLGRRVQIEELMRQLAFGAAVPAVDPKDLISGELLQWNPKDGTIKLRYRGRDDMKDWADAGSVWVHPAPFRGPHSVTIKGDHYPKDTSGIVMVCYAREKYIVVVPGLAPYDRGGTSYSGIAAKIELKVGETTKTIGGGDASPVDRGRAYTIGVVVNATQVSCFSGNRPIARANKQSDHWGSIAIGYFGDCEIVLSGKVELSWLQGLVDKERQGRIEEFGKRWKPQDDLPAWLFEATAASVLDDPDPRDWPAEMDGEALALLERVIAARNGGEAAAALRILDAAAEGAIPDLSLSYVRGVLLADLGRHEEAAATLRKVRESDPDFVPSAIFEARALAALGRTNEAVAIYRALIERFPRAADLHADVALSLGASGGWEEADRLVGAALSSGVRSEKLDAASRVVHKAAHGPAWPRRHDYESPHYVVASDMDPKVCFEASQILEQAYAVFMNRLERAPATNERFKVFLFSGQAGYQDHIKDLLGETVPHSAGLYVTSLRQLFIWNLPEREEMMQTVRHEGFHQYLHRIMDNPPLWFNEGLAEYFEEAKVTGGKWTTGATRRDHLRKLEKLRPLSTFLFLDGKSFMETAGQSYAQAWAFLHFLLHTTRENRQLFDRFWDSFKKIPAHADAVRAALGARSIEALDTEFRGHLESLMSGR